MSRKSTQIIFTVTSILFTVNLCFGQTRWTARVPATSNGVNLRSVTYGNGLYVAVGDSGTIITSPNGDSWTKRMVDPNFISAPFYCIHNCGETLVAGSKNGLCSSIDGIFWKFDNNTFSCISIAYGGNVHVPYKFAALLTSSWHDKIYWGLPGSIGYDFPECVYSDKKYVSLIYGNDEFVAVGNNGVLFAGSGQDYTESPFNYVDCRHWLVDTAYNFNSIAYGNGKYVATASTKQWDSAATGGWGTSWVLTSEDCKSWTKTDSFTTYYNTVAFYNGRFIVVGFNGFIAYSSDGIRWIWRMQQTYNLSGLSINAVTWGPAGSDGLYQFLAVGDKGLILSSTDDNPVDRGRIIPHKKAILKINNTISKTRIIVTLPQSFSERPLTVQLFNISSRKVSSVYLSAQNRQVIIPASGYSAGVYQLLISSLGSRVAKTITVVR